MSKIKIIGVVGPTGSGKTKLGVKLAQLFNGVILSADSRQIYRGLDIGSNKEGQLRQWHGLPSRTVDGIDQLLIDIAEPGRRFTVADWLRQFDQALSLILQHQQLPIIVGGTGLYVTALLSGWVIQPQRSFEPLLLLPTVDRRLLYQRADDRIVQIFDQLTEEIKGLIAGGVPAEWFTRIGLDYRFANQYLAGELSREEAIKRYQFAHHAYIRRQLTWWRHHEPVSAVTDGPMAQRLVGQFLQRD